VRKGDCQTANRRKKEARCHQDALHSIVELSFCTSREEEVSRRSADRDQKRNRGRSGFRRATTLNQSKRQRIYSYPIPGITRDSLLKEAGLKAGAGSHEERSTFFVGRGMPSDGVAGSRGDERRGTAPRFKALGPGKTTNCSTPGSKKGADKEP